MSKFRQFKVGDFFNIHPTNAYKITNKELYNTIGNTPVLSNSSMNNGIGGYCGLNPTEKGNIITFSDTTTGTDTIFYQPNPFIGYPHVQGLYPKTEHIWSESECLYLISVIKRSAGKGWSYSNKFTRKFVSELQILLPVTTKYIPDFKSLEILAGGGIDMSNIDTSSWKEFRLDELFEKIKTEKISGKANDFPTCKTGEYTIPLLTAGADNQGLARYAKRNQCPTILKNVISISANGANTGVTFYQNDEFAVLQDAYAIKLKDIEIPNEQVGLFLASCIGKILHGNFSWTYKAGWERIKGMSIKLPVKESEEIDWDYMQERIAELEQERIAEIEQYLIATGLNDYELTDEDKEILATKLTDGGASQNSTSVNGCLKEAKSFKLEELFGEPTRGTRLIKERRIAGDTPLVTAGFNNQGVAEYISNEEQITFNSGLTIDMFGNCFYRDYKFKADDNILVFDLKNIPKEAKLYIASAINKVVGGSYSYSRQYRVKSFNNTIISLPIMSNGTPDWEFMEKYIKATEKVVIKDIVEWKNEMIEKTKEVVGGTYVKK